MLSFRVPFIANSGISALMLLGIARFLLGAAEGGVLPSMNSMVATYASKRQRGAALGVSFLGF